MQISHWKEGLAPPSFPQLESRVRTRVAVVGGGMAGVLSAYLLRKQGIDCVLLEAESIGCGETGNTTAKLTAQHRLIYDDLTRSRGAGAASLYADANTAALREYEKIIEKEAVDCDYRCAPAYVYARDDAHFSRLQKEYLAAQRAGLPAFLTDKTELPFPVRGALGFEKQARFHPLKFLYALAQKLPVYENARVLTLEGNTLKTEHGAVEADCILLCTHYPIRNFPGLFFLRMYQERSYVVGLTDVPALDGMYIDADPSGHSFRTAGDLLLVGGEGHKSGRHPGACYERLASYARSLYPQSGIRSRWSAQDCATLDGLPYIGRLSAKTPHVLIATGFDKWGMSHAMVAALLLRDLVLDRDNPWESLYSPQRSLRPKPQRLFSLLKDVGAAFTVDKLKCPAVEASNLRNGQGGYVIHEGKRMGGYRDARGKLWLVDTTCPHLKCQLSWNQDELSWDCPCHGSRFDYTGKLLDNPAQTPLERKCPHHE